MKYLLVILCSCYIIQANAQQLSLQEAISIAIKNNFDIQIAKNNVDVSVINNHIGMAGGLPTVTATASDQQSIVNINQKLNTGLILSRNGATSNNLNANITGSMVLFNGYRVITTKKRLEELEKQSQQQLNLQIQNTIALVMQQYFEVVRLQANIKTLEVSIALSKQQLALTQSRQAVGYANNADVYQSKINLNTREQDLLNQQLIIQQAKVDLLNILNLKPDSAIIIKDIIVTDENLKLEDVLNGIDKNPLVISLQHQIKINELAEKETAAQRQVELRTNVGINYGRNQANGGQLLLNQNYGPFFNIGVSVPLYNGGNIKRQEQTAKINTTNARLQKESAIAVFKANTTKMYQAYTNNLQQAATQKNTVAISENLVQLVLERYKLAQATILEVQEALRSYEEAAFRLTNISFNAKMAEIELKRIAGTLY
jgi:outer membrane protein TolC